MSVSSIHACELPDQSLLARYAHGGAYADCYATEVAGVVSHAAYVEAFYTGAIFRLERFLLARLASKPSTDAQVRQLAAGERDSFSAWKVEARTADQLLMCDLAGRTRSWLMVAQAPGDSSSTRLYFGSAVVPVVDKVSGEARMGFLFKALLGFHKLYSRVLLHAARSRLRAVLEEDKRKA
ncbi:hypothetical protein RA8CHR_00646 [Variovorax sp. RA8]|nr:hypothetical protein RA8CHR_00646 [Variovorax sp. RA8]